MSERYTVHEMADGTTEVLLGAARIPGVEAVAVYDVQTAEITTFASVGREFLTTKRVALLLSPDTEIVYAKETA